MMYSTQQATDDIIRTLNHTGLNPDDQLVVRTEERERGQLTSIITGVDVRQARIALSVFMSGRLDVIIRTGADVVGEYLIVTQPIHA